ncbi:hypothetical protein RF11_01447 [Thelohanellus kitauei]|uniref:Endonuclease/exonuclease/phosphatase domain-containing protein n=1 Tax=Thelohanellus kitauei TaxID=669202 RepID=A0A0C2MGL4_THEKT|nr:hypothetical protein RF11_01447 [Thelohanellus kitauei]
MAIGVRPKNPQNRRPNRLNFKNSSLLSILNVTGNSNSIQTGKKKKTRNPEPYRSPRNAHIICIQETHIDSYLSSRFTISGHDLICKHLHKKHGRAIYDSRDIERPKYIESGSFHDSIHFQDIHFTNLYKPPSDTWSNNLLIIYQGKSVYIGDFNSHHSQLRYKEENQSGSILSDLYNVNNLKLLNNPTENGSFHSTRWNSTYYTELFSVSPTIAQPKFCKFSMLNSFQKSQHLPIVVEIGVTLQITNSDTRPRWYLSEANWQQYSELMEKCSRCIPKSNILIENAYHRFSNALLISAKKSIPRGSFPSHIPCLDHTSKALLWRFERTKTN